MPYNPKSKENLKKGEATRFSGETAAKNGRKGGTISGQKKRAAQKEREISIHAPCAGRGDSLSQPIPQPLISIHAPCAGRGNLSGANLSGADLFQSTRPCGARLCSTIAKYNYQQFQSTRPCGARRHSV